MNPTVSAILAGVLRQIIIACSGALIVHGAKLDDGSIEMLTGVALAIVTAAYSAVKKTKLYRQLQEKAN